jgi:hypothetical protein
VDSRPGHPPTKFPEELTHLRVAKTHGVASDNEELRNMPAIAFKLTGTCVGLLCTIGSLSATSSAAAENVSSAPDPYVLKSSWYHLKPLGGKELHARCGSGAHVEQQTGSSGRRYAVFTYFDDHFRNVHVGLAEKLEEAIPNSQEYRGFSYKFHNDSLFKGVNFQITWKCIPDNLGLH